MEDLAVSENLSIEHDNLESVRTLQRGGGNDERYFYLRSARCAADFIRRTSTLLSPMGIHHFSHHALNSLGEFLDPFGTLPDNFMLRYMREDFHKEDLALRHLLISNRSVFRHKIDDHINASPYDSEIFRRNQQLGVFLRGHKLNNSFYIPIVGAGYKAVFWVSLDSYLDVAAVEAMVERYKRDLVFIGSMVDTIGRDKFHADFHNYKKISLLPINGKPLQLLETLAKKDLSLNEAAEVLEISISTANQHVAAAKKALLAHTLHGAILAALQSGLITLDI